MRRTCVLALFTALFVAAPAVRAYAATKDAEDDARRSAQDEEDKKKKQKEKEWSTTAAPLPSVKNAGPCPFVKVLYDAGRYVELKDNEENAQAVGWTGEIQNVRSVCAYKGAEPIHLQMAVDFSFGRGPQAVGDHKQYRYWVAVTARNTAILDKSYFDVMADFKPGQDRIYSTDRLKNVVIPRGTAKVSGSNFEVLVGFDVTPEMAAFNHEGKRFRVNSGATAVASAAP